MYLAFVSYPVKMNTNKRYRYKAQGLKILTEAPPPPRSGLELKNSETHSPNSERSARKVRRYLCF